MESRKSLLQWMGIELTGEDQDQVKYKSFNRIILVPPHLMLSIICEVQTVFFIKYTH